MAKENFDIGVNFTADISDVDKKEAEIKRRTPKVKVVFEGVPQQVTQQRDPSTGRMLSASQMQAEYYRFPEVEAARERARSISEQHPQTRQAAAREALFEQQRRHADAAYERHSREARETSLRNLAMWRPGEVVPEVILQSARKWGITEGEIARLGISPQGLVLDPSSMGAGRRRNVEMYQMMAERRAYGFSSESVGPGGRVHPARTFTSHPGIPTAGPGSGESAKSLESLTRAANEAVSSIQNYARNVEQAAKAAERQARAEDRAAGEWWRDTQRMQRAAARMGVQGAQAEAAAFQDELVGLSGRERQRRIVQRINALGAGGGGGGGPPWMPPGEDDPFFPEYRRLRRQLAGTGRGVGEPLVPTRMWMQAMFGAWEIGTAVNAAHEMNVALRYTRDPYEQLQAARGAIQQMQGGFIGGAVSSALKFGAISLDPNADRDFKYYASRAFRFGGQNSAFSGLSQFFFGADPFEAQASLDKAVVEAEQAQLFSIELQASKDNQRRLRRTGDMQGLGNRVRQQRAIEDRYAETEHELTIRLRRAQGMGDPNQSKILVRQIEAERAEVHRAKAAELEPILLQNAADLSNFQMGTDAARLRGAGNELGAQEMERRRRRDQAIRQARMTYKGNDQLLDAAITNAVEVAAAEYQEVQRNIGFQTQRAGITAAGLNLINTGQAAEGRIGLVMASQMRDVDRAQKASLLGSVWEATQRAADRATDVYELQKYERGVGASYSIIKGEEDAARLRGQNQPFFAMVRILEARADAENTQLMGSEPFIKNAARRRQEATMDELYQTNARNAAVHRARSDTTLRAAQFRQQGFTLQADLAELDQAEREEVTQNFQFGPLAFMATWATRRKFRGLRQVAQQEDARQKGLQLQSMRDEVQASGLEAVGRDRSAHVLRLQQQTEEALRQVRAGEDPTGELRKNILEIGRNRLKAFRRQLLQEDQEGQFTQEYSNLAAGRMFTRPWIEDRDKVLQQVTQSMGALGLGSIGPMNMQKPGNQQNAGGGGQVDFSPLISELKNIFQPLVNLLNGN